jgi:hypothetical protein
VFLCETGLGVLSASVRNFSKNSASGSSPTGKNCPGSKGWHPITASAGDKPPSRGTEERIPSNTQGKWLIQSGPAILARSKSFKRRWNLSTNPFDFHKIMSSLLQG